VWVSRNTTKCLDELKEWITLNLFSGNKILTCLVFRRVRKKRLLASSCPSVRPHGTNRLPLDGFSWNLIYEDFSKLCRGNSSVIKIGQPEWVLYMKTDIHFWLYIVCRSFLLRMRNVSDIRCRENQNTHFVVSNHPPPPKLVLLWDNVEKYCGAGQASDDNMAHAHCMLDTLGYKYTHRLCNTHCLSSATVVARRCLCVTLCYFVRTLPVCYFVRTLPVCYFVRTLPVSL
jgi:hypothetical protein